YTRVYFYHAFQYPYKAMAIDTQGQHLLLAASNGKVLQWHKKTLIAYSQNEFFYHLGTTIQSWPETGDLNSPYWANDHLVMQITRSPKKVLNKQKEFVQITLVDLQNPRIFVSPEIRNSRNISSAAISQDGQLIALKEEKILRQHGLRAYKCLTLSKLTKKE